VEVARGWRKIAISLIDQRSKRVIACSRQLRFTTSGTACCAWVSNCSVRRVSVAVAFLCASGIVLCQSHLASSVNPSHHVVFEVHDRNMIDALLLFGQQEHIGIGIDYIDAVALQRRVTIQLRAATVADVLDAIAHRFGYRWSTNGRVVRITHTGAMVGSRNLLNTRIAKFKVSEIPLEQADCNLKIAFYFALNPKSSGIVGDCPYGAIEYRIGGLDVKNATVGQILDALVSQQGNGAWVVQQPAWTMDKDLGYGLWKVLAYDRTDGEYSRGLRVRGLGLQNR
jgi:hypothetical protein